MRALKIQSTIRVLNFFCKTLGLNTCASVDSQFFQSLHFCLQQQRDLSSLQICKGIKNSTRKPKKAPFSQSWVKLSDHKLGARSAVPCKTVSRLLPKGSLKCAAKFSTGPCPVTYAWMKNPSMENMANLPFLISLTFNSANCSGSFANPSGSNAPPGWSGSKFWE